MPAGTPPLEFATKVVPKSVPRRTRGKHSQEESKGKQEEN